MKTKHSPGTSSKSDQKTRLIAAAAARLFSTKGYAETSMEDVAAAARVSKGGTYHYFDCKEDRLYFVLSGFMDLLLEGLEQGIEGIEDPAARMGYAIHRHVEAYAAHMYSAKALLNEARNLSATKLSRIKSKEKRYFSIIAGVVSLRLGHALDNSRLTVATFNLLGMCNWIYSWYDPRGAIRPDQLSQIIFDNFTEGLSSFHRDSSAGKGNAPGRTALTTRPKPGKYHNSRGRK